MQLVGTFVYNKTFKVGVRRLNIQENQKKGNQTSDTKNDQISGFDVDKTRNKSNTHTQNTIVCRCRRLTWRRPPARDRGLLQETSAQRIKRTRKASTAHGWTVKL